LPVIIVLHAEDRKAIVTDQKRAVNSMIGGFDNITGGIVPVSNFGNAVFVDDALSVEIGTHRSETLAIVINGPVIVSGSGVVERQFTVQIVIGIRNWVAVLVELEFNGVHSRLIHRWLVVGVKIRPPDKILPIFQTNSPDAKKRVTYQPVTATKCQPFHATFLIILDMILGTEVGRRVGNWCLAHDFVAAVLNGRYIIVGVGLLLAAARTDSQS